MCLNSRPINVSKMWVDILNSIYLLYDIVLHYQMVMLGRKLFNADVRSETYANRIY